MEEIVDAITTQMKIDLAIVPGGKSVITGNAGPIPVVGTGTVIDIMGGSAVAS